MISTKYSIVSQTCMSIVSVYKQAKGCWHTLFRPVSANKDRTTTNHEKCIVIHDVYKALLKWK